MSMLAATAAATRAQESGLVEQGHLVDRRSVSRTNIWGDGMVNEFNMYIME